MRNPTEIAFRLRQEAANIGLAVFAPADSPDLPSTLAPLPDPGPVVDQLRLTPYADEILQLAEQVLEHRFPLLGLTIETGPDIRWRRDYVSGRESEVQYFRRIPYLDAERVGDHKLIWELSRHQHLVLLAQAWRLHEREEFRREIIAQLEGWWAANPFQRSINWASALEVAFRALSWIWIVHLMGRDLPDAFRQRLSRELNRHGHHLEQNLSIYFSRNTHLLGEGVALHAIGKLFPAFSRSRRWVEAGARVMAQEMDYQVREDGSHFEQSAYYHVYALDFFLLHSLLADTTERYRQKLTRMAQYLDALLGPDGRIPLIGDDDGGRLFHPYGQHDAYGRATLASCSVLGIHVSTGFQHSDLYRQAAWWIGPGALSHGVGERRPALTSQFFVDSGMTAMAEGNLQVLIDAGTFGGKRGGHSHSDTLSLVVRRGAEDLLVDAGTYTYVGDWKWRRWFRGSAAHNTVRVDGLDQARSERTFGWDTRPEVLVLRWRSGELEDFLDAVCRYEGFEHRRSVLFRKPDLLFVLDRVNGPGGEHLIEQFWHFGVRIEPAGINSFHLGGSGQLTLCGPALPEHSEGGEFGWQSGALGRKRPNPVIRSAWRTMLPAFAGAVIEAGVDLPVRHLEVQQDESIRLVHSRGSVVFEDGAEARFLPPGE